MPRENKTQEELKFYGQTLELGIIKRLLIYLKSKTFIDVGAEKGEFSDACFAFGLGQGVLCEPLPSHYETLRKRFQGRNAEILPFAIHDIDGKTLLHIACDKNGKEVDYFHSIHRVENHEYFRHGTSCLVECRSLESLCRSGKIPREIGLLKIDTEGNDLKVLQGIGLLRPELIMCEFVPPAVYPDWPFSFAENLVPQARKLGYHNIIAFQRSHGVEGKKIRINPTEFMPNDWGNLLLIRPDMYAVSFQELKV